MARMRLTTYSNSMRNINARIVKLIISGITIQIKVSLYYTWEFARKKGSAPMITGIGLDLVDLKKINKIIKKSNKFPKRILSERELEIFGTLSDPRKIEYLAGRFAAKEAFAKARGTGIREGCTFHQIEILNDKLGKPIIYFDGAEVKGFVSITHTGEVAAAQVILQDDV